MNRVISNCKPDAVPKTDDPGQQFAVRFSTCGKATARKADSRQNNTSWMRQVTKPDTIVAFGRSRDSHSGEPQCPKIIASLSAIVQRATDGVGNHVDHRAAIPMK